MVTAINIIMIIITAIAVWLIGVGLVEHFFSKGKEKKEEKEED